MRALNLLTYTFVYPFENKAVSTYTAMIPKQVMVIQENNYTFLK